MRAAVGLLFLIGLALCSLPAAADTYYRYRDKTTGRDVYVNKLEQVPQKYRDQAKIVLEVADTPRDGDEPSSTESVPPAQPGATAAPGSAARHTPIGTLPQDLRKALASPNMLRDSATVASGLIDFKLAAAGRRPLAPAERGDFASLLVTFLIAGLIAGLAALVAWIVIIVTAIRDNNFWWALFIFLFSPLAYLYLFLHGGKDRGLFKALCTLGMLAPFLVGLVGSWRFYAWFQAVMQARGVPV